MIASHQRLFWLNLSIYFVLFTFFGISIPYLWVRIQYLDLILARIRLRFFKSYGAHHANAGSNEIWFWTAYSASWTGYDSFIYLSAIQVVLPSFHFTSIHQPFVVGRRRFTPCALVENASCILTWFPSHRCSAISSKRTWRFPFLSTWAKCFQRLS